MMFLRRQATGPPPVVSTENHGSQILAITGFFTGFALFIVLLRFYVRIGMLKTIGADDYVMLVSMLCLAGVFACFVFEVHLGIGKHISDPGLLMNFGPIMKANFYHSLAIVLGISCVKISVGLFLLRLVDGTRYQRFIRIMIGFLVVFTLACLGTLIFQCLPVAAAWDFALRPGPPFFGTAKCYSTDTFRGIGLFNGSINIFTDFFFAVLPIPIVWNLNVNTRTKLSLICIMSLGFFACAAAVVKEVYLSNFFTTPDFSFNDTYAIWNLIELAVGILAACLPVLRPLFAFILETATAAVTGGSATRSRGSTHGINSRHRYYNQVNDIKLASVQSNISHSTGSVLNKGNDYGVGGVNITTVGLGSNGKGVVNDVERERHIGRTAVYGVNSTGKEGPRSKLEQILGEDPDMGSSEENILMPRSPARTYERGEVRGLGIMKTTEVHVT